jgi:hypothetical protein
MKALTLLVGVCLVAVLILTACDSGQSNPKTGTATVLPYPTSQQTPEGVPTASSSAAQAAISTPTVTASGGGNENPAPSFEAIRATVKRVIGDARPVPKENLQAAKDYGHSLDGKTVHWQGWVGDASPNERFLEQYGYDGSFRVDSVMNDPNTEERIGTVEIDGVTRQQVEQFSLWHNPLKLLPYQKVEFTGTIDGVIVNDPLLIFVNGSRVTLIPGLMTPLPEATPTATIIIQGNENPAPPFEVISATMKSIVASTTPGSDQRYQALGDYSRTLRGKTVQWEGWIYAISPNEPYMQQHNELDTYDGSFGLWTSMYDLNARQDKVVTAVVIGGVTRQQVEQFVLWHDPTKYPPFEKIRFTGTIDIVGYDSTYDSYEIYVNASSITLVK